jgi:hypothetical protein
MVSFRGKLYTFTKSHANDLLTYDAKDRARYSKDDHLKLLLNYSAKWRRVRLIGNPVLFLHALDVVLPVFGRNVATDLVEVPVAPERLFHLVMLKKAAKVLKEPSGTCALEISTFHCFKTVVICSRMWDANSQFVR